MSTDTEPFARFDPADYLNTVEEAAAYLEPITDESDDDPGAIAEP